MGAISPSPSGQSSQPGSHAPRYGTESSVARPCHSEEERLFGTFGMPVRGAKRPLRPGPGTTVRRACSRCDRFPDPVTVHPWPAEKTEGKCGLRTAPRWARARLPRRCSSSKPPHFATAVSPHPRAAALTDTHRPGRHRRAAGPASEARFEGCNGADCCITALRRSART